ncbi:Chaperone protein DnaJ [Diplonema papillatum]|nr:Chaperone protein DnaJ [Diplonema papillatum]
MPISTRLYSVLDVNAKASHDEIKKAYHKAAVRYHPDRQGGEASEAKFKEVQGAYEILSDPDKRKIYDRFGEKGLILMSQGGERAATFGALDASFIGCFFCTASAPLILFLIFVCLRVDGHTDWEWKNVFVPLWVIDGILGCIACLSLSTVFAKIDDGSDDKNKWLHRWTAFSFGTQLVCFIAFTALLSQKLDDLDGLTWYTVFVPAWIFIALDLLFCVNKLRRSFYEFVCSEVGQQPSQRGYLMYVFWVGFDVIRLPIFVGLLAGKLSGDLDASWFVVGIPYFIQFSLMVLTEIVNSCISPAGFRAELGPLVAKIIGMVFMFSTFFLVIAKAAGGDYSLAAAFTPVWAVIGCGCCIICALPALNADTVDEESVPIAKAEKDVHVGGTPRLPQDATPGPHDEEQGLVTRDLDGVD